MKRLTASKRIQPTIASKLSPLPDVLAKLHERNRNNVLIVPAVFSASGDWMRGLRRAARDYEDKMTLRWRSGLGGR